MKITAKQIQQAEPVSLHTAEWIEMIANKAIEIALAEQATQDQFLSAKEAEALGAGNAQWRHAGGTWAVISSVHPWFDGCQYRAIRKEVPAEPLAELLMPEVKKSFGNLAAIEEQFGIDLVTLAKTEAVARYRQNMEAEKLRVDPHSELRALYAQQVKDGTVGNFVWDNRPIGATDWYIDKPPAFCETYEYRCTPKANLVKLDGKLVTSEAAIAEWRSKKDTHVMWFKFASLDWTDVIGMPENMAAYFEIDGDGSEYQLRPKAKKPVSWLDMPVGVAVVCPLDGSEKLTLAPADQQPWIAVQEGQTGYGVTQALHAKGIWTALHASGEKYRVIGIADGWELK